MPPHLTHPILLKPIAALPVSQAFAEMAKANHYTTLQDILKLPLYSFPNRRQSGYRMLKELLGILETHSLEQLIED